MTNKFVYADTLDVIAKEWIKNNYNLFCDEYKEDGFLVKDFDEVYFYNSFEEFLYEYLFELLDEYDETVEFEFDKAFSFNDLLSDYRSDLRDAYDYANPYCG